jgi:hypothetical protein
VSASSRNDLPGTICGAGPAVPSRFIKKQLPDCAAKDFLCYDDLGEFRKSYVKDVLEDKVGELSALDHEVIESLRQHEILSSDDRKTISEALRFGERLSDHIAEFGGSWRFIISFGVVLFGWIVLNAFLLTNEDSIHIPSFF